MRIINTVLGDATGGRWQVVIDYNDIFHELGHQSLLVAEQRKVNADTKLPQHGELQCLRNSGHYDLMATFKAMQIVRRFKPDLIIAHCSRAIAVFKRAVRGRIPVIGVSHSNNVKRMAKADGFFNISTYIAGETARLGGANKPAFLIPNKGNFPADIEFQPREWQSTPVIGAIGRFDPVKGFHILLDALGILKQRNVAFKLKLAGEGIQKAELEVLIDQHQLHDDVEMLGWTKDPNAFLRSVDLLCIPALSDAFGLTPLDAAAHSTPQVLSTAYGHLDMFSDGESALYAEKENAQALADSLQRALESPAQMQTMAAAAFQRVTQEYTHQRLSERLDQALQQLANR